MNTNFKSTNPVLNNTRGENGKNTPIRIGSYSNYVLYGYNLINTNSVNVYAKFYDKNGAPVVGTDTPVMTLLIPSTGTIFLFGTDVIFQTTYNLYVAFTTGAYLTDNTAPTNNIIYQLWYV